MFQRKLNFIQAYGLTETSPLVTTMLRDEENYSSVGYALSSTELKIVDNENMTRGPNEVMLILHVLCQIYF